MRSERGSQTNLGEFNEVIEMQSKKPLGLRTVVVLTVRGDRIDIPPFYPAYLQECSRSMMNSQ